LTATIYSLLRASLPRSSITGAYRVLAILCWHRPPWDLVNLLRTEVKQPPIVAVSYPHNMRLSHLCKQPGVDHITFLVLAKQLSSLGSQLHKYVKCESLLAGRYNPVIYFCSHIARKVVELLVVEGPIYMNNLLAGFKNVGQQVKMHPRSKAHNDILVYHGFSALIFKINLQAHIHPRWVLKKQWPHSQYSNYSEASDWRPSVVWCNTDNIPDSSYRGSNGCLLTHEERVPKLEKHRNRSCFFPMSPG